LLSGAILTLKLFFDEMLKDKQRADAIDAQLNRAREEAEKRQKVYAREKKQRDREAEKQQAREYKIRTQQEKEKKKKRKRRRRHRRNTNEPSRKTSKKRQLVKLL
jgi:hypothetical protein